MTQETPIKIEEQKPPTAEEQLETAQARCEELYALAEKRLATIGALQAQKSTDDSIIARQAAQISSIAQQFNALKTKAEDGAIKLQQIAAVALGGVDIVGVVGEVESALGKIKTAMTK